MSVLSKLLLEDVKENSCSGANTDQQKRNYCSDSTIFTIIIGMNLQRYFRLPFDPAPASVRCQAAATQISSPNEHEGRCLAFYKPLGALSA